MCKMLYPLSPATRGFEMVFVHSSFFQRGLKNLSHCSSEPFFLLHLIGISPPEYSKPWISVTESLLWITLLLDNWEQSPCNASMRCPWSHLEIPRLKKIVGVFLSGDWFLFLLTLKKAKRWGDDENLIGFVSLVCTHIPNCSWKSDLFAATHLPF